MAGPEVFHAPGKISHQNKSHDAQLFDPQRELTSELVLELVLSGQLRFVMHDGTVVEDTIASATHLSLIDALLTPPPAGSSVLEPLCITLASTHVAMANFTCTMPPSANGYVLVTVKHLNFSQKQLNDWWPATSRAGRGGSGDGEGCHQERLHRVISLLQGRFRYKSLKGNHVQAVLAGQDAVAAAQQYIKLDAAHACGNRSCIRASHLHLTSRATNGGDHKAGGGGGRFQTTRKREAAQAGDSGAAGADAVAHKPVKWARRRKGVRALSLGDFAEQATGELTE